MCPNDIPSSANAWPQALRLEQTVVQALPAFLLRQRWYPVKDAGLPTVSIALWTPLELPEVTAALAVWRVQPPDRAPLELFMPVALLPAQALPDDDSRIISRLSDGRLLADAFADDAFVQAWVALMLGLTQATLPATLQAGQTARLAQTDLPTSRPWQIRRSKAEQSNTSIRIGETGIVKVIRKLEEGVHPELEMSRRLSEVITRPRRPCWRGSRSMAPRCPSCRPSCPTRVTAGLAARTSATGWTRPSGCHAALDPQARDAHCADASGTGAAQRRSGL